MSVANTHSLSAAVLMAALCAATGARPAGAQGLGDVTAITGPQYVNYKIGASGAEKTVTQLSIPLAVILPISSWLTADVSTSWADSRVSENGVVASKISGLTDTQARLNASLFGGRAVLTIGGNIPTGMYKVPDGQQAAAGQIGSSFLLYPVSSMGSGGALTSGLALAWSLGEWNVGLGGSYRYSQPFDAYEVQTSVLRFEPGAEARMRFGIDRAIGDGRLSISGTRSSFGDDKADSTTFASGPRTIGQVGLYMPTSFGDITITAWDLYRGEGQQIGAVSPWENIASGSIAVGFNMGGVYVQPNADARAWMRAGEKAGFVGSGGVRMRWSMGPLSLNPSLTYSVGNVYPIGSTTSIDVSGFRGLFLVRLR
ncbi:MAG: hypothetical protein FJ202_03745 [Gemmatimonadetes bacterium]|nr:hypothetical protein [Gemmatimonadota bacterium]